MRFEPLRLTAWLQTGVVDDGTLPIDGVLLSVITQDACGEGLAATVPGTESGAPLHRHMPLERRYHHKPYWYYAASFAQWETPTTTGADHWHKRFDTTPSVLAMLDQDALRGRLNTKSGRYRGYRMPIFYRHALHVRWYLVGNVDRIAHVLPLITHLGKKRDQGWGAVLRWEIEPWPDDWSEWREGHGLTRPVPTVAASRYARRYNGCPTLLCGYRPSYWLSRNQLECWVPTGAWSGFLKGRAK